MSISQKLPDDDPRILAWEEFKKSEEYQNAFNWAEKAEHREGSLWTAFIAAWNQRTPQEQSGKAVGIFIDTYYDGKRCHRIFTDGDGAKERWTAMEKHHGRMEYRIMDAFEAPAPTQDRDHEIRLNDDGTVDEIVGSGFFHLEEIDDGLYWMSLDPAKPGKDRTVWVIQAEHGALTVTEPDPMDNLVTRDRDREQWALAAMEQAMDEHPSVGVHSEDGRYTWPERWAKLRAILATGEEET